MNARVANSYFTDKSIYKESKQFDIPQAIRVNLETKARLAKQGDALSEVKQEMQTSFNPNLVTHKFTNNMFISNNDFDIEKTQEDM
jgi:ribosome-associated translation inhibitor RaiA